LKAVSGFTAIVALPAEKQLVADHKAELLAEFSANTTPSEVPKVPEATMAETLIREAAARGWGIEFISTKAEVPPLPREIRFELTERGFPQRVVDRMSHGAAVFHLFRDGGSRWK